MIPVLWARTPRRFVSKALCKRVRKAAHAGDVARAARVAHGALLISPQDEEALNRVAKYLTLDADPYGEEPRDHAGIDALSEQIGEVDLPHLHQNFQNVIAVSFFRRGKPLPDPMRQTLAARDDDDAMILKQLEADQDVDVYRLLAPLFQRHGLPVPPLIPEGAGVDRFGFPDCPPVHGDRVTVAMTAFNAERTIEHAMRSVLSQTWRNLEFFIVDDASTDGTTAIIEKFAAMDDRIIPLHNPANIGTYCSKNRALEQATGRWFTCHDADDWSHPMKIERQVEALIDTDAVANFSQWIRSGAEFSVRLAHRGIFMHPNYSSLMFQTAAVRDSLGFYDSVLVSADAELIGRLQKKFGLRGLRDARVFASLGRIQPEALTGAGKFEIKFNKMSKHREDYISSFRQWHRTSDSIYIPIQHEPRKFPAPRAMVVSQ